jgi:ethanolamine utilization protein EutQ (cupin superfamily)
VSREPRMNGLRVFRKGSYTFNPFRLDQETLENTYEVTLSEYGSKEAMSCGIFRMKDNGFELTYPNDEVMLILDGEVEIVAGDETLRLKTGDIIQVREGLKAALQTRSSVEIFFVGYPVKSVTQAAANRRGGTNPKMQENEQ